jgi:HK97 gp10 family phage protein
VSNQPLVTVVGGKELRKTLKAAGDNLADLKAVHQAAGNVVVARAQAIAPRRSGALAGSIRAAKLASGVAVRAGSARVPYAGPIHWGWPARNIAAQPFLTNAAQQTEPEWTALYEEALDKIIDTVRGDT